MFARRNLTFVLGENPAALTSVVADQSIKDPNEFVYSVREKLGDEKRLVRVYGSETVLVNLTGEGGRVRVHLVNYGRRPVDGLRVRVRGSFQLRQAAFFGVDSASVDDFAVADGGTELSIPHLETYGVIDLAK